MAGKTTKKEGEKKAAVKKTAGKSDAALKPKAAKAAAPADADAAKKKRKPKAEEAAAPAQADAKPKGKPKAAAAPPPPPAAPAVSAPPRTAEPAPTKISQVPPPAPAKPAVAAPAVKPAAASPAVKPAAAPPPAAPRPAPAPASVPPAPPASVPRPAAPPAAPPRPLAAAPAPAPAAEKPAPPAAPRTKIKISEAITVKELADKMNVKVPDVIKKLMSLGTLANMNQRIDGDTAALAADAFGFDAEVVPLYIGAAEEAPEDASKLKPRPPVVTVMGHVDHGKTSLLDAIRETRVAEKEAGGITQHIGAYQVKTAKGLITFLDTPGHEAFTAMRARGAQATDIVVLVVAADDGVMPQTVEALDHARAAGVPIVVAINKCDLPAANPQKIKQELSRHNLAPEDWGGKTVMVEVSARQKTNLDKLLEMLLLEAELLELKADPDRPAQAVVVEAKLDPRRGPVATVLLQKGTLRVGDPFICGMTTGKIRALLDQRGERVKEAPPACPVEILGLAETPQTGDKLSVVATEREAREISDRRRAIASEDVRSKRRHMTLESLHDEAAAGKVKDLPIVLKADVQGSVEAVRDSLEKLSTAEIAVRIIHSGVGGINNSDVVLAAASDAVILGFNVRPDPGSEAMARREAVEIKSYRIIYDMVNDVKAALEGLLSPTEKEVTVGWAEVRQVFRVPKSGSVAGCYVTEGKLTRAAKARIVRNGAIVFEGGVGGLRRFKDDVREVEKGFECGVSIEGYQDIKPGDRLEFFIVEKQARKLA
ncbi:MAG: translation initiation factor IF-2 [Elusimicrobiota bacterium]